MPDISENAGSPRVIRPSVAKKDICSEMLVTAKELAVSIRVSAINSELRGSDFRLIKPPEKRIICIIPALTTESVKPVMPMKKIANMIEMIL